jgi:hypothetical protein
MVSVDMFYSNEADCQDYDAHAIMMNNFDRNLIKYETKEEGDILGSFVNRLLQV